MTTVDPRLKFQIPTVYVSPNQCMGCGKSDNGNVLDPPTSPGMVDLQRDFDFYGAAYLCKDCAFQVARVFGAISPEGYAEMERSLTEANVMLSQLRKENLGLKKVVDGYRDYGELVSGTFAASLITSLEESEVSGDNVSGTEDISGNEEPQETDETSDDLTGSDGSGVPEVTGGVEGSGDSEVNESVNFEGPSDVRNDSGDKLSELLGL